MTKTFKVIDGGIVPPQSNDQSRASYSFSDRYFAKIKTIGNEESLSLVSYDFKNQIWKSATGGLKEVIEYYIE